MCAPHRPSLGTAEFRHVQKSKKEMEAAHAAKNKTGVKTSKTGPRAKKYDGPGSAIEAATKKKKAAFKKIK